MKGKIAYLKAILLIGAGRMVILLPDKILVRLIAIVSTFIGIISSSPELRDTLQEARLIFEKGGEGSRIARAMLRDGSRRRIRMVARSIFL